MGNRKITALMCAEIGGFNAIEPLLVAAEMNLPVIDCDGMGRAFPELQMITPFIYGCKPYPSTLADDKDRRAVILNVDSPKHLENHFRKVVVEMGCSGGFVMSSFNREDIQSKTIHLSYSRAWYIGNAVINARKEGIAPVDAIVKETGGKHLISGKITMVRRETTGGFNKGYVEVRGLGKSRELMKIEFQNEKSYSEIIQRK